ncbi:HlyD family efflux transporter periplasmic adaptor subunit [Candidatus Roizmanbacteria bacterium]|nr:HlyD family efflux transporter periplasmic adaptor subunit [Candidatus Roizmanbacteria bacterium]
MRIRIKAKTLGSISRINPLKIVINWWKMRGIKKWLLFFVFCIVLLVVYRIVLGSVNRGRPDLGKYDITTVTKYDLTKTITKEGTLHFAGVVDYPMPASGIITDTWVQSGQEVTKGQRILGFQSTASQEDQATAISQYLAAKTALENAKVAKDKSQVNLETARQKVLETAQARQNMDDRFASGNRQNPAANRPNQDYTENEIEAIKSTETEARSSFAIAEKEFYNADGTIQAAQAALNLSLWKYQLTKDAVVTAPVNGLLVNLNFTKGEVVNPKSDFLFRIISSNDLIITLKASEAEAVQFEVGQETEFKTAIYPDLKFKGRITAVDTIGTEVKSDTGTVTEYVIKIKPEETDKRFLSPMTVDTDTIVQRKSSVLVVPNSAVSYSGGKRTVTLVVNGRTQKKEVSLGIISDNGTEIVSGLSEGDNVLTPKASKL